MKKVRLEVDFLINYQYSTSKTCEKWYNSYG